MLHSAFRGGESLAMKSNSIYFPKKKKIEKTPHHLTFPFETLLFKGTSLILFCIYSFPEHTTFRNLMKAKFREKSDLLSEVLSEVFAKHLTL